MRQRQKIGVGGEADSRTRREIESIGGALDGLIAPNGLNLQGKRVFNAIAAVDPDEYITLGQLRELLNTPTLSNGPDSDTDSGVYERDFLETFDDFAGFSPAFSASNTGSAFQAYATPQTSRPGIIGLLTDVTSGSRSRWRNPPASTDTFVDFDDVARTETSLRMTTVITSAEWSFNLGADSDALNGGSNAMGIRYDAAVDSSVRAICRAGGVETSAIILTPFVQSTWYKFSIVRVSDSLVEFYIDNELIATITTNIPAAGAGSGANAAYFLRNTTGSNRTLHIDYFYFKSRRMVRI